MKNLLKLEDLAVFLFSVFLFQRLDFAWWWYPLLFFTPDLGMLGYLHNQGTGAFTYNLVHHQGLILTAYLAGALLGIPMLQLVGAVFLGHSGLDRVFGYGLKYPDDFQHTHLGWIGKGAEPTEQTPNLH